MILDFRIDASTLGPLVAIYDALTGEELERHKDMMYVDTDRGIYRLAARDEEGHLLRDPEGSVTWTEHSRPLRIEPRPELGWEDREMVAREIQRRELEGLPDFGDKPPTTLDEAMHEVKIEDACKAKNLDERQAGKIIQSYRFSPSLLHTILEHNGDHATYVETKLGILRRLNIPL